MCCRKQWKGISGILIVFVFQLEEYKRAREEGRLVRAKLSQLVLQETELEEAHYRQALKLPNRTHPDVVRACSERDQSDVVRAGSERETSLMWECSNQQGIQGQLLCRYACCT